MSIPLFVQIYHLVIYIVILTLHVCIYMWIDKLERENCDCSKLWHRNIVKAFAIILFVVTCINAYLISQNDFDSNKYLKNIMMNNMTFLQIYSVASIMISFSYIFIMFDYIRKLKEMECECSEDWKREFGWYYSIVVMILWGIILLSLIGTVIYGTYLMFSKK